MYQPCRTHRTVASRAVSNASDAIRTLSIATDEGSIECVVLACVDARRMPLTLFVFDGRPRLDDDLETAVEAVLAAAAAVDSPLAAIFLGSSRPGAEPGPTPADERRWRRLVDLCGDAGIDLLDWLLLSDGATCSVAEGLDPGPGW